MSRPGFLFIAITVVQLSLPPAWAQLRCEDVWTPTRPVAAAIGDLFVRDGGSQAGAERVARKLGSRDFSRPLTPAQVDYLVKDILRWRDEGAFSLGWFARRERPEARVLRALAERAGAIGVTAILRERGLMTNVNPFRTKLRQFLASPTFERIVAATSLLSLVGPSPMIVLPTKSRVVLSPQELETLVEQGTESDSGRAVIAAFAERAGAEDRVRALNGIVNKTSLFVAVALICLQLFGDDAEKERAARARGDALVESLGQSLEKLAEDVPEHKPDTPEDIHFEVARAKFEASAGHSLSEADRAQLCRYIAAPNRCR